MCLRIHHASLLNLVHQVETLVFLALKHNPALQLCARNACPLGKQFATAIASIAVHSHLIPAVFVERRTVGHAQYPHLLSIGLGYIHFVDDAGCTVEVKRQVLKAKPLTVLLGPFAYLHNVVVGRFHRVYPQIITHFQVVTYFFARHFKHIYLVFVLIQVEHVAHIYVALVDTCVKR